MKRLLKTKYSPEMVNISAAENEGTSIYVISAEYIKNFLTEQANNSNSSEYLFISAAYEIYGLRIFNQDVFYGSLFEGDTVYLLDTDGKDVYISNEDYDPEELLEKFDIEDLQNFIRDVDNDVMKRYFTEYEVDWSKIDIEDVAISLLNEGKSLQDVVQSAQECGLLR